MNKPANRVRIAGCFAYATTGDLIRFLNNPTLQEWVDEKYRDDRDELSKRLFEVGRKLDLLLDRLNLEYVNETQQIGPMLVKKAKEAKK